MPSATAYTSLLTVLVGASAIGPLAAQGEDWGFPVEPRTSVLAEGEVFKLAVDETGVYRIDAELLRELGIDPATAPPSSIRLYSKGGAMLPEVVGDPYPVDLQEVALQEVGDGDDGWGDTDRLVFYGEGEDVWRWNERAAGGEGDFVRVEHLYDEQTYYYLEVGGEGLRVSERGALSVAAYDDAYTARVRHEEDLHNLLQRSGEDYGPGQGSGQDWFGFEFKGQRRTSFGLDVGEVVVDRGAGRLTGRMVASALQSGTRFGVEIDDQAFTTTPVPLGNRTEAESSFARFVTIDESLLLEEGEVEVGVDYPGSDVTAHGWLDYVQITHPARLRFAGEPLGFRSSRHAAPGTYGFEVDGAGETTILWDVSDPLTPNQIEATVQGGSLSFGYRQDSFSAPREFIAFDPLSSIPRPVVIGPVANSNLHGETAADMLIVYADTLRAAAERLADHRRDFDGMRVVTAAVSTVAEEFGGGRRDPGAIRALTRMLWRRGGTLRYVLLLGDGTYDPRGIDLADDSALVPTYQTASVTSEVSAFPTDDYYALLEVGEGRHARESYPSGTLDVGVGRIPAGNLEDADVMVDKIIRYDTDPAMLGEWRLRSVFVADDEDNNLHVRDMDLVAERDIDLAPELNQVKIYADAYDQVATAGEQRFPKAAEAINRNVLRGNLLTTYLGHGGPRGWAQERILNDPDIAKWDNADALPVFITATCTFTGYDDPTEKVAGEKVLFKRGGGAVATLSTTRPVFTNSNRELTLATHRYLLDDTLAHELGIGQLMMRAKNSSPSDKQNDRKYSLFGDPAMRLALPELEVAVTEFDSLDLTASTDTVAVPSLREVTLAGEVRNRDGSLADDFDGTLTVTVFDQERTGRTLGQDPGSQVEEFRRAGATLFKGRATVIGGMWQARFMLPRDVSLARGLGRISLYAAGDDGRDGAGLFGRFFVDGLAPPAVDDDEPPVVDVGMDGLDFVDGGITGSSPEIVAALADDTGINVSGTSIGHDLTATLRGPEGSIHVLNDYYEAESDDYSRGLVRYPLFDLPVGEYTLELRAWDLANNTAVDTTRFIVLDASAPGLRDVLAYPNPMTDEACFAFEHIAAGEEVEVTVDIYTMSGQAVRSLRYSGTATGSRFDGGDCVRWDGRDDAGAPIIQGLYLYKVTLATADGSTRAESSFERIVVAK